MPDNGRFIRNLPTAPVLTSSGFVPRAAGSAPRGRDEEPTDSYLGVFGEGKRVFHVDPEIAHRILDLAMSHSTRSPALVLVVDGLRSGSAVAQDFEELAESGFGPGLRLVGATDRAGDVLRDTTGRGNTALAAIAEVVTVEPLDDGEFIALTDQLGERRILFYPGAELAAEYRRPWLLRAVLANGASPERQDVVSFIPATMGLALVHAARAHFKDYVEVARDHRLLARDALNDDEVPDAALALASANAFVIRRDALSAGGESASRRRAGSPSTAIRRAKMSSDFGFPTFS